MQRHIDSVFKLQVMYEMEGAESMSLGRRGKLRLKRKRDAERYVEEYNSTAEVAAHTNRRPIEEDISSYNRPG